MSRNLTYSYAAIDHEIVVAKPSGSVFAFPVLANVSDDIRALVARELIGILHEFVAWLDEPPADWAHLLASLPPLSGSAHAQTLQKEEYVPSYANTVA